MAADVDADGIFIPANSIISGSWSKVGGGFVDRTHSALSNQFAHRVFGTPAYISATSPASLTEATLNGATVTVSLGGPTYASGVSASSFALVTSPAIAGLSISNVTGGASGSTSATLTLGFTGTSTPPLRSRCGCWPPRIREPGRRRSGHADVRVTVLANPTVAANPATLAEANLNGATLAVQFLAVQAQFFDRPQ